MTSVSSQPINVISPVTVIHPPYPSPTSSPPRNPPTLATGLKPNPVPCSRGVSPRSARPSFVPSRSRLSPFHPRTRAPITTPAMPPLCPCTDPCHLPIYPVPAGWLHALALSLVAVCPPPTHYRPREWGGNVRMQMYMCVLFVCWRASERKRARRTGLVFARAFFRFMIPAVASCPPTPAAPQP